VDLGELGGVVRNPELRGGSAAVQGRLTYQAGNYESNGHANAFEVELMTPSGVVRPTSIAGDYSVSNQRTLLSNLSGHALGGTFSGNAEVVRWVEATMRAPHHGPTPPPASQQRGIARFQLQGMSLAQLGQSFSTRAFPVDRLHLAGTASGTVQAAWRGPLSQADAQLSLRLAPPSRPQPGEAPLIGQVQATYSGSRHTLTISQLNAASPAGNVMASGALGSTSANISLNLSSSNVEQLQAILAAFHGPRIPLLVNGRFTFKGTAAGRLSAPSISGHLEVTDFDTVLRPAAAGHSPAARRMHWDSLATEVQLSSSSLLLQRGLLRRGQAQLDFEGSMGLRKYRADSASTVSARFQLRDGDLADVTTVAGYSYPLSGRLDGTVRVGGTWQSPQGQGVIQISHPGYGDSSFNVLRADLRFAGQQIDLENVFLGQGGSRITGVAGYDFGAAQFHFNLQGSNFDLAKLARLQGNRISVGGKMDFSVQGWGTRQAPVINGALHLRQLAVDTEREGDFTVTASTREAVTHLVGRSQFTPATLDLDGDVRLRGDLPGQLTLHFSRLDLDPLLHAYVRGRLTGHSSSAGTVVVSGPLLRPRDLRVRADVSDFQADIENLKLRNSGALQFVVDRQVVSIQHFRLVGDGTDFEATGTAQLASPRALDLRANGIINLKVIQTLNPDYMSSGLMTVGLRVGGTMAAPDVGGRVQITDGSLANIDLPSGLSNINGTLLFNQDRLRVQKLSAQTGGGLLNLGGFITYNRNLTFDLTADGRDIRLRYPPGMSTSANVSLHWVGGLDRSTLSGNILVTRFQLARNFDFASYLARAKAPASLPNPHSPLNNLRLDVHVATTPELDVQTAIARVAGDADLRLRGTAAKPVVLGRVDIARGDVNFSGTRYHLERGDITFSNPVRIEPILDLEASARVRDYDITLGLHGQLDKLNATYSSDPPLPTADIIALLAMGRTRAESALLQQQTESSYTRTASNAILSEALNTANNNRLEKIFGVSRVKIDPEAGGAENNPSWTRVTIEQQISNALTLTYITNVSQAQEQIIQAEYYLTRNISLIALRDQNGVVSFDISIRRRKK
jgi:translocation and assembly module TamB